MARCSVKATGQIYFTLLYFTLLQNFVQDAALKLAIVKSFFISGTAGVGVRGVFAQGGGHLEEVMFKK
jgi:hypothetical protein